MKIFFTLFILLSFFKTLKTNLLYLLLCIVPPSTEGVISHIFETCFDDLFQFLHNVILSLIKKIGLFSYLIPIPQALTSFSPIRARAFLKILFTFFIISLSFLFMFYNTKLYCFVLDCTLIKIKCMRKWQILDLHQEFAIFD